MVSYLYDGTFDGFLSCLHDCFILKVAQPCKIYTKNSQEVDLFSKDVIVENSDDKCRWITKLIREQISPVCLDNVTYAFHSEARGVEMLIYNYILLGLKVGRGVDNCLDNCLNDGVVRQVQALAHKVNYEIHRLKGFVRFEESADGVFYAKIQPKYNILTFLSTHFQRRFCNQLWVIHDISRGHAIIYNRQCVSFINLEACGSVICENEKFYQDLWRTYFNALSIEERKNPELQRHFVPLRYRKDITEFIDN
ncbi:MAG: TIGR03915 family putative DNA repair protein [Candidatus Magnetoovum sp. WYHC-5]|nr:TIGR03915 family putative DNA repair protein [Candidatus Magnetoovum sp. WYHC-5]